MKHFTTILTLLILPAFFACSDSQFSDKNVEVKAENIAKKLDSVSIKVFYEWGFGHRGDAEIFAKRSDNPDNGFYNYGCFYFKNSDNIKLSISRFENFKKDFPCNIQIDTSKYHRVNFTKLKNGSVRISVDNQGQDQIIVESIPLKELFATNDPFEKFKYLSDLKESLGILGDFYRPDIGNFIQFYLSSQHILTYQPDNSNLNPKFKEVWLKKFATGKTIKKNWNLRKLDKPMDNG